MDRSDAFEIDGTVTTATVLRLATVDVDRIEAQLRARIAETPQKFLYAPIVVDVGNVGDDIAELPLHDLAERLRACKLVPVGAANLPSWAVWNAAAAGMANVKLDAPVAATPAIAPAATLAAAPAAPAATAAPPVAPAPANAASDGGATATPEPPATVTVRQPVRSGQVVHAERADLVVLAAVNPGAHVVADGHIHVYGVLRGRASAGARGLREARVFCQSLEAELISIAGQHLTADEIPTSLRGRPAQIWLDKDRLRIQPL